MILYVASAFGNRPEVREVMRALTAAGHSISHDWTGEALDPAWTVEAQAEYLQKCGAADYAGVALADALVLVNHTEARDSMAEMGIALGMETPVLVLYPERRSSVFFHRAAALCPSVESLLEALA